MSAGNAWGRLGVAVATAVAMYYTGGLIGATGTGLQLMVSAGFMAGALLGNYIFPSDSNKQSSFRPNMPRADQYPTQTSAKDLPIPKVYGTTRVAGNIIWMGPAVPYEVAHQTGTVVTDDGGGGKGGLGGGGGGGDSEPVYSYETRYRRSFLIGVAEGQARIGRCWKGKTEIELSTFTQFEGDGNTGLADMVGETYADYRNLCCAFFEDYDLGNTQALPNFVFEVNSTQVGNLVYHITDRGLYVLDGDGFRLNAGPITNEGGFMGVPCFNPPYEVGDRIMIGGDNVLDSANGHVITAITTDKITLATAYAADTLTGDERVFLRVNNVLPSNAEYGGVILGDYIYCCYTAGSKIAKINRFTYEADVNFFDAPTPGWYAGEETVTIVPDPNNEYIYVKTYDAPTETRVLKFKLSDGSFVWSYQHADDTQRVGGMAVGDDGTVFVSGLRTYPDFPKYQTVYLLTEDGVVDGSFDSDAGTVPTSTVKIYSTQEDHSLMPSEFVLATGSGVWAVAAWETDGTLLKKWQFPDEQYIGAYHVNWYGEEVSDDGQSVDFYFYMTSQDTTYNGSAANFWRMKLTGTYDLSDPLNPDVDWDISIVAATYVTSVGIWWVGADGNIHVARDHTDAPTYTGDDWVTVLDYETLEVVKGLDTRAFWGTGEAMTALLYDRKTTYYDEYPPNIIQDIMTNGRYGGGFSVASLINTETFASALEYCMDNEIKISVALTTEQSLPDFIEYICSHFGGFIYESSGKICCGVFKDEEPVAALTRDDLVADGDGPPVTIKKRDYSQTYNRIELAWTDRENTYDATVEPAYDNIDQRDSNTVRKKSIDNRGVHLPALAAKMAWRYLFDSMYRFTMYSFMVSYKNMLLEVGDVITLTDGFNLTAEKMRIMSISEDVNGRGLAIQAVEEVERLYPDIEYDTQQTERTDPDAYDPEDSTVAIRETANGNLQLSMIPSTADATGWYVYRSYDGTTYTLIGRSAVSGVTSGNANSTGTTLSNLPAYPNIVHRPDDSVVVSIGTVTDLASASDDDFFNGRKICKIGDEVIGYQTCVETATAGTWTITGLIRGMMGTTPEAHVAGETFTTMDVNFTYPLNESDMGKTIYFKVTTYHGDIVQDLSDVSATSYTVQGEGLRPLPVSLMRISGDEGATSYATDDVTIDWYYCSRVSGFGRGGFGTALYGAFTHPDTITSMGVVLSQTDDTEITSSTFDVSEVGTPHSLLIEDADRGGNSSYKVKLTPGGTYASLYQKEITLEKV